MDPVFDPVAALAWLRILHGDAPGWTSIVSTQDWAGRAFPTTDLDQAVAYATQLDHTGAEGIYVRVTTLAEPPPPGKRSGAADSIALTALWADLDLAGPGHKEEALPPDQDAGQSIIAATGFPEPTIWVHSGGGLYPIWLLDKPYPITDLGPLNPAEDGPGGLDAAKALTKDWQRVIEYAAASRGWRYGRGVGDLARVLRLPGSINRKEGLARPCRILAAGATGTRYSYHELAETLTAAMTRISPPQAAGNIPADIPALPGGRGGDGLKPGADLNARGDWAQILEPVGWRVFYRNDDVTYWTRPGKTTGISASTNALGTDHLHVFTTSAAPLEGDESYSKFGAYATLYFDGDHQAAARALAKQNYGDPLPDRGEQQRQMLTDLLGPRDMRAVAAMTGLAPNASDVTPPAAAGSGIAVPRARLWTPEVDVTNFAVAADWLRDQLGRGRLAGYFIRDNTIVHTPRETENGYQPLTAGEHNQDGPAQIRPVTPSQIASRITYTHGVYKLAKHGDKHVPQQTLFPKDAARLPIDTPDLIPHLRPLAGVVHSPVLRADGSILERPGYDPVTHLLHLPPPGLTVPTIPDRPTGQDAAQAVGLLSEMLAGFAFVTDADRANYVGLLLTPLIRALAPPPYRLAAIGAPMPAAGKTLLATIARLIHGGVMRAEMPEDDAELRKQITAILDRTTGPLVHIDNVTGVLRSSTLAGLLTSATWDDRRLGSTDIITTRNDRLWIVTGNNVILGGDLLRRTLWITIDPGIPHPEERVDFAIPDLEHWVREHRPRLLHALLTLARYWVAQGQPTPTARSSDSYSRWTSVIGGILDCAGIPGAFAVAESGRQEMGADDEEWHDFLTAVHKVMAGSTWTVKELLGYVDTGSLINPGTIPPDALPGELGERINRPGNGVQTVAKSLGKWLRHRDGRWAGTLTARSAGLDRTKTRLWQIHEGGDQS